MHTAPPRWLPLAPSALAAYLAEWLGATPGRLRVALDGPDCADPAALAGTLIEPLRALGRPAVHVPAARFWRDASLRLEYGHHDVDSLPDWLDAATLRRETLDPLLESGRYLPSLRDPGTNRSTRELPRDAAEDLVLIVSGSLLLGHDLPFDRTVHLAVSSTARARRTAPDAAWTLPALDRYDAAVAPTDRADVVIKLDDPKHPALREARR